MNIATIHVRLKLAEAGSLKDKRSIGKRLMAALKSQFQVSVAEVGDQDNRGFFTVGMALVTSSQEVAQNTLQRIGDFLYEDPRFSNVEMEEDLYAAYD